MLERVHVQITHLFPVTLDTKCRRLIDNYTITLT